MKFLYYLAHVIMAVLLFEAFGFGLGLMLWGIETAKAAACR